MAAILKCYWQQQRTTLSDGIDALSQMGVAHESGPLRSGAPADAHSALCDAVYATHVNALGGSNDVPS